MIPRAVIALSFTKAIGAIHASASLSIRFLSGTAPLWPMHSFGGFK
jgi:hypothetical protein